MVQVRVSFFHIFAAYWLYEVAGDVRPKSPTQRSWVQNTPPLPSIGMADLERRTNCCSTVNCCTPSMFHSTLPFLSIMNCHCLPTLTAWLMHPLARSELAGRPLLGRFFPSCAAMLPVPASSFSPTLACKPAVYPGSVAKCSKKNTAKI